MNPSRRLLVFGGLAAGVSLAMGVWLRSFSAPQADANEMAKRLLELPKRFGDWELVKSGELLPLHERELQCFGYVMRTYVKKTGERADVAILLGPHGPIAQHTPDVCYNMSGFEEIQKPTREEFKVGEDKVTVATSVFKNPNDGGTAIKIAWGWNDGEGWDAPEGQARFRYAGRPFLYKMQVVYKLPGLKEGSDQGLRTFIEEFLPVLNQHVGRKESA